MIPGARRWRVSALAAIFMISALYYLRKQQQLAGPEWGPNGSTPFQPGRAPPLPGMEKPPPPADGKLHWHKLQERYPVSGLKPLPHGRMKDIPKIQAKAPVESAEAKEVRLQRRAAVKESFEHSWGGYKKHAWLRDEVTPISAQWRDTFGGWSATLVDSLDTLWIMGLKDDFELAVQASWTIDFSFTEQRDVNVFETTIRYMGGFLAAYDISEGKYPQLLYKAIEVGDMLMSCFDTPNRMPITRWDWKKYTEGNPQKAPERMLVSEIGSLSLEFTRLSQLTGDFKYYDAIQRVSDEFEKSQDTTQFPGMWPVSIDASKPSFDKDTMFTLGGMSDSLYEYFPKQYLLVGGLVEQPKKMYEKFINVAKKYMFFRILNPRNQELLVSGDIRVYQPGQPSYHGQSWELQPRGQHLTCFTGGMVGMAAKIFNRPDEIKIAEQLTEGCVWAYDSLPHGVAPEIFTVIPCGPDTAIGSCEWSQEKWYQAIAEKHVSVGDEEARKASVENVIKSHRLPPGFSMLDDKRYILRPEAIESVFYMLRITGDMKWADKAWRMFQAVERVGRTEIAASAIMDVTAEKVQKVDSMESFWLAETLKYFYLCFEEWDVVSLDEFVLNTEAHPLRRPGH